MPRSASAWWEASTLRLHNLLLLLGLLWALPAEAQFVRFPSIEIGTVSVGCRYQSLNVADDNPNGDVTGSVCDQVNETTTGVIWTKTSGTATTSGWVALTSSATVGTVTSVALTAPGIFSVSGSPITSSGTLALSLASQTAGTLFAGPISGAAAAPTFRALDTLDLPVCPSTQIYKSDGTDMVCSDDAGASSGAPAAAQYLTLALDASLSNERVLDCGTGLSCTDGGANGDFDVAIDTAVVAKSMGITIDGAGSAITTGVKGFVVAPITGTITASTLLSTDASATACSIVLDVWQDTYANYPPTNADSITAAAQPTLSSAAKSQDVTLTGWTTSVTAGRIYGWTVDSVTGCTRVTHILTVTP